MKMKKKILLSLLASTLLVAQSIELKPLSITSTAIKTDELKSTDAVEIYTADDIQKAHVQNIYEFLNQQTSVITVPSYGNPFTQKLDIRGYGIGDGYQNIVITINGRKINNIDMVAPLLSSLSPASIEKIEIIKSSGIVTGGDGANAGAINITTKKSNDKEVTIYGGTYGTLDGSFYIGHNEDKFSLSTSGEAQKSNGIRHINSSGDKDESSLRTASIEIAYYPISELELRGAASFARTDVIYSGYLSLDMYNDNPTQTSGSASQQLFDTDTLSAGATYYFNDKLSLNIDANREDKKSTYENLYYSYKSVSDYEYDSFKSTLNYIGNALSLTAGIDGFNGERKAYANTTTKENLAGFAMSSYKFQNSTLKAGYRYERVGYDYKDAFSSLNKSQNLYGIELGYNYAFDAVNSVFVNYAKSYQASDIDRFFNYGGTFNGFISPMKAKSYSLGYNSIKVQNKLKVSIFYVDLKDEIYYYADPTYINAKNTNIDKSYKYGLDIYDKWLITDEFNLVLNYNYVKAVIEKEIENGDDYSGNDLPGVSNHTVKTTFNYLPNKNTTLALTQVYRSKAYAANDFNNNFAQKQDAYLSTDISASYAQDNWELFAKINNLFNQKNGLWIQDNAIYPLNFTTTAIAGLKLKF